MLVRLLLHGTSTSTTLRARALARALSRQSLPRPVAWSAGVVATVGRRCASTWRRDVSRLVSLAGPQRHMLGKAAALLLVSSAVSLSVPFGAPQCTVGSSSRTPAGMGQIIDSVVGADSPQQLSERCAQQWSNGAHQPRRLLWISGALTAVFVVGAGACVQRSWMRSCGQGQTLGGCGTCNGRDSSSLRACAPTCSAPSAPRHIILLSITPLTRAVQEMAFFDQQQSGALINRLAADTAVVGKALTDNVSDGLRTTAQTVIGAGMMAYLSPGLAAVVLAVIPPLALVGVAFSRHLKRIAADVQDALARSTAVAEVDRIMWMLR